MNFSYEPRESRVIFGSGCVAELPAEVERLGIARALKRRELVGDWPVGVFEGAATHVPRHRRRSMKELGMREGDLDRAAEIAIQHPYHNPRPVTRDGVRALLDDAFHGRRP